MKQKANRRKVINKSENEGDEMEEIRCVGELKPCPFCGGSAYIWECEPRIHRFKDYRFCVACGDCEMLFGFDPDYGGVFGTKEEATEKWNNRT